MAVRLTTTGLQSYNPKSITEVTGGRIRSGSGGQSRVSQEELKRRQEELAAQKAAAEKAAKEAKLKEAREAAAKKAAEVKAQQEYVAKLRAMSVAERRKFLIDKAKENKAYNLQQLKDKGKTLTPSASKYLEDYKAQQIKIQAKENLLGALEEGKKQDLMTGQSIKPLTKTEVVKKITKLLVIDAPKKIPQVFKEYGISLAKGSVKAGLYAIDEFGYATQIRINKKTGKILIPKGTKAISDRFGKVKNWANYSFKTNPFKDPDYQAVGFTTAFALLGITSASAASKAFGIIKGKAVWDAIKNPTPYNVAIAESLILPGVAKKTFRGLSKVSPKYLKFKNGKLVVRGSPAETFKVRGKTRFLKTRVQKPSIKRPFSSIADFLKGRKPGQFKKFTKDPGLILKKQTVATGAKQLSKQVQLEGKEITAVNAAADQLTSWIRRKKIIRKPIAGESNFPNSIKKLLTKFDNGTRLTNKEFAKLNLWLQKNVAPNITLLERSLYADPEAGLRINRLGIKAERTATFRDIIKGNFKFRSAKPQVLIFENAKVAKFPKSLLSIKKKLLAGKKLTTVETNKLIRWQVKTGSGKFKPIGSTIYEGGRELEVTLAPGEYIKRVKQVGFTYIKGKKVTFVKAEIYKPTKTISKLIKAANDGKLSKIKLKSLESRLSKILGRKIKVETPNLKKGIILKGLRRPEATTPILRISPRGIYAIPFRNISKRVSKRNTFIKKRGRIGSPRIKIIPTRGRTPKPPKKGKVIRPKARTGRKVTPRKTTRPKIKRIKKPLRKTTNKQKTTLSIIQRRFEKRLLKKSLPVYYVVEKVRGKFKRLYPRPLILKDAKDYAVYSVDNNLSKTAFWIQLGKSKKVVIPPKEIQGYYNKNSRKVRAYRIRYGRKKQLVNGFIEKRKYFSDTKREKAQLRLARKKSKRKMSPTRKKQLLSQLRKARLIRLRKIKKQGRIKVKRRKVIKMPRARNTGKRLIKKKRSYKKKK